MMSILVCRDHLPVPQVTLPPVFFKAVSLILLICGAADAQLAQVPIYSGPVRSPSTGGVLTGVPVPQGGVIIIGTYGVGRTYSEPMPGARLNHAMRHRSPAPRDQRSHLDERRDFVGECHQRSAARLDAEDARLDAEFNSQFAP
ncbi:MAG TPA: hypothetical protein VGG64_25750 [Pirellulales bacterium]|jgi:hypothetical protein